MIADAILFGLIGALVRVLVSLLKTYSNEKKVFLNVFVLYALTAVLVGAVSGMLLGFDKPLALLGGYAGLDLIDGYQKMFIKRKMKVI